jgi:hypothetical protein
MHAWNKSWISQEILKSDSKDRKGHMMLDEILPLITNYKTTEDDLPFLDQKTLPMHQHCL